MKIRALSLLLALVMVFGLLPVTIHAEHLDNSLGYVIHEEHVEITGYFDDAEEVVIPAEIAGLPVTVIGIGAFENCTKLKTISIPETVDTIDYAAFRGCENLTSITIPKAVTRISGETFYECYNLTNVDIPDGITSISDYAFYCCEKLSSISIPKGVTYIGDYAFSYCSSLTSIQIPERVKHIGYDAFTGCDSVTEFHVDKNNQYYSTDDHGVLFDNSRAQILYASKALAGSYNVPDGIVSIHGPAFDSCTRLNSIYIPASVTFISYGAFYNCSSLAEIHVNENNPNYSSDDHGVLFDKEKTCIIIVPKAITGSYTIPDGFTFIDYAAFEDCSNLTSVVIPDSVTYIKEHAFSGCSSLTSIVIPDSVTSIGSWAFSGCSSLSSIVIPDSVASIEDCTFLDCVSLNSVVIPDSVTYIGADAFASCSSLISISIPKSVTSIGSYAFYDCSSLTGIYVDENNPNYSSDDHGVLFDKEKTRLIIAPGAISGFYVIPDGVTSIGYGAFENHDNLTGVSIPASVTTIGYNDAFAYCNNLSEIYVDENNPNYSSDDYGVLFDKTKTHLIAAPGAIKGSYTVPDSVTTIDYASFVDCNNLTGIHVGESNPNYSSDNRGVLFNKEKTLLIQAPGAIANSYTIPDSVSTINDRAFYHCLNLTNISIPDSVTTIGWWAFENCLGLTSIVFPDSVATISDHAFDNCLNLTSIYFEGSAPLIYNIFRNTYFLNVTATAYYPAGDPTWTENELQDYGGNITWVPYFPNNPFTDIPSGAFYEAPVLWAVKNNITTGATADSFNPNGECLRAHVVTFLHRAAQNPEPNTANNPFSDVKTSDFFYKPVLWAVEKNITNGTSATKFGSYDVCNRAAVVTFLWRAAGSPEPKSTNNPFADVKESDFYYKPVLWAIENGITNGVDATHFGPTAPCNRAQVVTFLYRTYN